MTIAAALLLFAAPAPAPASAATAGKGPTILRECWRKRNHSHCLTAEQQRLTRRYALPAIEQYRAAGDQVFRVFYVDGSDRDLAALEFVRPKGADPLLRVHFPPREGEEPPPLTAPIDGPQWWALVMRSRFFDRALVPRSEPKLPKNVLTICVHPWSYFVEAVDPPDTVLGVVPAVRRRTEQSCDAGLAAAFADEAEAAALDLVPACTALDRSQYDTGIGLLVACGKLRGDRIAAAQVLNAADPFLDDGGDEESPLWRIFTSDAVVTWADQAQGSEKPAVFWAAKAREAGDLYLRVEEVLGETRERVRLRATLGRFSPERERHEAASVEQLWILDTGAYRIERASIGPFEPVPKRGS